MPPRRANPEHQFQRAVAEFLDLALPDEAWWSSIDHAGGGRIAGANRKARGVKAGLPDIIIVWRGRLYAIELKSQTGRLSAAQRFVGEAIARAGGSAGHARSLEEVMALLDDWRIPTRARRAA